MYRTRFLASLLLVGAAACSESASDDTPVDPIADASGDTADAGAADTSSGTDTAATDTGTGPADTAGPDTMTPDAVTPGPDAVTDTSSPLAGTIVLNEVAAAGDPDDWFELVNTGDAPVDLAGWTFTDDIVGEPGRSPFPDGAVVPAGGYYLVQFDDVFPGFGLGGDEELGIYDADGELVDGVDWEEGASPAGASLGRIPDATGAFETLFTPTPGAMNVPNAETCGNGTLDDGETCDDGGTAAGDGCGPTCEIEPGYACDGTPSVCATVCGDGVIAGDEACDDANTVDGDGCSSTCELDGAVCGDGVVDPGEECDDGNTDDDDGCSDACGVETIVPTLVLNEVAASGDPADWFELKNVASFPVSMAGWRFEDDDPTHIFLLPATVIAPGAYVSFELDGEGSFDFGIGRADAANLFYPSGELADSVDWEDGDSPEGGSIARIPDGTGEFETTLTPTRDAANN